MVKHRVTAGGPDGVPDDETLTDMVQVTLQLLGVEAEDETVHQKLAEVSDMHQTSSSDSRFPLASSRNRDRGVGMLVSSARLREPEAGGGGGPRKDSTKPPAMGSWEATAAAKRTESPRKKKYRNKRFSENGSLVLKEQQRKDVVERLLSTADAMKEKKEEGLRRLVEHQSKEFTHTPEINKRSKVLASNMAPLTGPGGRAQTVLDERDRRREELYQALNEPSPNQEPLWQSSRYDDVVGHKTYEDFEEWKHGVDEKLQAQREANAKAHVVSEEPGTSFGTPRICKHSARLVGSRQGPVYDQLYDDAAARRKRQEDAKNEFEKSVLVDTSNEGGSFSETPTKKVFSDCVTGRLYNNGTMRAISTREKVTTYEAECGRSTPKKSGTWQAMSTRSWERSLQYV